MSNSGAYPLDPTTPVGQFRLVYGDIDSDPYSPAQPGVQEYEELSDAEISAFLAQGSNSVSRAIAVYYLSLAGKAAKQSKNVQDYDLRVDSTKTPAELRATAQFWFDKADNEDAADAVDAFEIVPTGTHGVYWPPEASPWRW